MRNPAPLIVLLAAVFLNDTPAAQSSRLKEFVTRDGDQLLEGRKPFRFVSFNIPNLHYAEDNVAFTELSPLRFPDRFEITDALSTIRQMGGQVARTYVLPVVRTNDAPGTPRYVLGPGKFNEDAFRTLDEVLRVANETGVRLILPFVDNWIWWGGVAEYAGFRGKPPQAFWTDPQVIADFKQTIRFLVLRTNTLTGVRYCDDKAILCWETGNELLSPASWTREIAAYIKSLDSNHLVMDGYHTTELRAESLEIPDVDIVTTHHYPGSKKSYAQLVRENSAKAKGKKPYVVGEFGFVETAQVEEMLNAVQETGTAGALIWSLRVRNRDGGFYWHSEPAGGNKYKAYHWPGFDSGAEYDERNLMALLYERAYAIRGLSSPKLPKPAAPHLLPISDPGEITWQGSVGARSYTLERAGRKNGPWTTVAEGLDETAVQYRPLFADTVPAPGAYFYRLKAQNESGISKPSNVVGPVQAESNTFVEEFRDFSRMQQHSNDLEIGTHDCRKAKEDAHRAVGRSGSTIVYRIPGRIAAVRLYAFFPKEVQDVQISVSTDGRSFTPQQADRKDYFSGAGDYDYWKPSVYTVTPSLSSATYLKLELKTETQLGRLELRYQ